MPVRKLRLRALCARACDGGVLLRRPLLRWRVALIGIVSKGVPEASV